jgi:hypothetical protein
MVDPQPSIYISGIRIDEPVTSFTDLIVSAVCFFAFYQLTKRKLPGRTILFFRLYFLLMAIATLLGAMISHAFLYQLSFAWKIPAWIVSMLGVALIERSAIEYAKPLIKPGIGKFFLVVNIVELLTVATIAISTLNFRWVEFHGGYGLLGVVTSFHLFTYSRTKDIGSKYIMMGVFVAALAAGAFTFKVAPHMWFNHLDLSHVLMAIASYILYRGALLLDRSDSSL